MNRHILDLFDFFIPRICPGCGNKLTSSEKILCDWCLTNIQRAEREFIETEFNRKYGNEEIIDDFYAPFIFYKGAALQNIIHELKYSKRFLYGVYLGKLIAEYGGDKFYSWMPDFIVPVPLHKIKKIERGYNQAFYIAKGISQKMKIPVKTGIIKRMRFTESQTKLTREERKLNIQGAFKLKTKLRFNAKKIVLVDDVITTGATTIEAAKLIKQTGAAKVFAVSVAIAGH